MIINSNKKILRRYLEDTKILIKLKAVEENTEMLKNLTM